MGQKKIDPVDDSSGKDVQDVKPLLPDTAPHNEMMQDNATDLMGQVK